jgi:heat-inducible transcriptional repressor
VPADWGEGARADRYGEELILSERAGTVLNILVTKYIDTAYPVASDDIARLSPVRVSSATVRNTMSQLTDEGYISRPHISAGAVPLHRGYRHYVESMKEPPELPFGLQQQIQQQFFQSDPDVESWSRRCAAVLSRIAMNLAIVTVPWSRAPRLRGIQLVYLEEFLAMLIIVLEEARLLRRLLTLEEPTTQDLLNQSAGKLTELFHGADYWQLENSRLELTPLEDRVRTEAMTMLREAETSQPQDYYVDGLRWLLNQPEFSAANSAKELVEMVEERVLLDSVLSKLPRASDVAVYIGDENSEVTLRPFGVILCQYGDAQKATGTICVIGPTRMGYPQAISSVNFLSSLMSQLVTDFHVSHSQERPPGRHGQN